MKRVIIPFIFCLLCTVAVTAQDTGKIWVGGALNLNVSNTEGHTITNVGISPEIGYKFTDKWAVGALIGYTRQKEHGDYYSYSYSSGSYNTFQLSPFLRSYIIQKEWGSFFLDGSVSYSYTDVSDGLHTFGLGVGPGAAIHLSDRISFISRIGWLGYTFSSLNDTHTNNVGLNLNLSNITFGININL